MNLYKKILFGITFLAFILINYQETNAYQLLEKINGNNVKWAIQDIPVRYAINRSNFDDSDIDAIHNAFEAWGSVGNSMLKFQFDGFTDQSIGLDDDFPNSPHLLIMLTNLPEWASQPLTGFAADTRLRWSPVDGHFEAAVIIFNGDMNWSTGWFIWPWEYDVESVALHEIGHFANGMLHPQGDTSPNPDDRVSVVEPIPPGKKVRDLFADDRAAVRFLYGIPPSLDLVFLIDTTGSMWDDIDAAKAAAVDIVNIISSQTNDYRIAVVDFEDFPYDPYGSAGCGDYMYHDVLNFSSDKSAIVSAIQGLPIRCGNDWQEAHYSALMHVLQKSAVGGWRDNVKKVVIVMTDAPPHDPEPYTGYTLNDVKNAAIALDPAVIYPIVIGGDSTTTAYMESLAEGTGGVVFNAANASEVVEAIMSAIETTFQAPTAEGGGPYRGNINQTITFDASTSYDNDGTIALYEWDWNNDGTYDTSTTSPTTTHSWSSKYSGTVKLRVTDNDGLTGIDTATVDIIVPGDLDNDGDVDMNDLKILNSYLNKPAGSCLACDLNGDGIITVLDSRKLVLLCTRSRCATQ